MAATADATWRGIARQALEDLKPFPGRFALTWRVALLCALVAGVAMLYKIPESAIGCYLIIFLMRADGAANVGQAIGIIVLASLVVFGLGPVIQATADAPLLRICVIAGTSFAFLYLGSASQLGEKASIVALVIAFILTLVDLVPAGEIVTRGLLYAWQMACVPMMMMIAFSLVLGTGPHTLLRRSLVERLRVAAEALEAGGAEAGRLVDGPLSEGAAESDQQVKLAGLFHTVPVAARLWLSGASRTSYRLLLAIDALPAGVPDEIRAGLAARCRAAADAIAAGRRPAADVVGEGDVGTDGPGEAGEAAEASAGRQDADGTAAGVDPAAVATDAATVAVIVASPAGRAGSGGDATAEPAPEGALPENPGPEAPASVPAGESADAAGRALAAIRAALDGLAQPDGGSDEAPVQPPFLRADALTNPDHQRFALKTTAAALICYFAYRAADWSGIHTALVTCYVAALGTTGETVHKLALRITGCLIGAAIGLFCILFVIPHLESVGGLMVMVFGAILIAAWVSTGNERISYGGVQIGLAFLLTVLDGFGPSTSLSSARDRIVGILLGNLVMWLVFTQIWPKSTVRDVRERMAGALAGLAGIARLDPDARQRATGQAALVAADAGAAREVLALLPFEPRRLQPAPARVVRARRIIAETRALLPALLFAPAARPDVASALEAASARLASPPGIADPAGAGPAVADGETGDAAAAPEADEITRRAGRLAQMAGR